MAEVVSAAVMIPLGVQADVTVYGRINNAIELDDKGMQPNKGKTALEDNDSTTDVSTIASRFGVKANSDLGNGLTAHGHYEFATNTDDAAGGITATRIATAGLSGGFGRIDVGNQWGAFYNTVGVDIDPTWWIGPIAGATPGRSPNTIKYSNSVGPLALEADLRLSNSAENVNAKGTPVLSGSGGSIGVRVAATDNLTLAAAFDLDDQTDVVVTPKMDAKSGVNKAGTALAVIPATKDVMGLEHTRAGVSGKVTLGQFWGALGWSSHEAENAAGVTQADKEFVAGYVGMSFSDSSSGWIGYSQSEEDKPNTPEPSKITAGLYHNLGGGLQFWYEGASVDPDETINGREADNHVTHYIGIRYDF